MSHYRRRRVAGGTYFFTVVTEGREPILDGDLARRLLGEAMRSCRETRPFDTLAIVLLPDHLHTIWTLPEGDADYSTRWSFIKSAFTRAWISAGGAERRTTESRTAHRRRGVWQRKFWEHHISDDIDLHRHMDYIHYNPIKHGHAPCAHAWPWSSFSKWVARGNYAMDWCCQCDGRLLVPPDLTGIEELELQ